MSALDSAPGLDMDVILPQLMQLYMHLHTAWPIEEALPYAAVSFKSALIYALLARLRCKARFTLHIPSSS